jgi:hypothetical protein
LTVGWYFRGRTDYQCKEGNRECALECEECRGSPVVGREFTRVDKDGYTDRGLIYAYTLGTVWTLMLLVP